MRAKLVQIWIAARSSYWFIPTIMSLGAFILAILCVWLDKQIKPGALREYDYLYTSTPDAARTLLATIAGSMITVAGVTFAITISSVGYAASQFGPRILTNFMRDRGNQVSLGAFLANFIYCLLVLRSVQSPVEEYDNVQIFIPQISILVALIITIGCAGVLIYYIHHVPESIHIANVLANIGYELDRKLDTLFPEHVGEAGHERTSAADDNAKLDLLFADSVTVTSKRSGYVQALDEKGLIEVAAERDATVRLLRRPGDFVYRGCPLAEYQSAANQFEEMPDEIRSVYAFGNQRTPDQDSRFLVNELIEIAARALSPGQNDPYTAIASANWLTAALVKRFDRGTPSSRRLDEDGNLRVVAPAVSSCDMIDAVFDQFSPYAMTDINAGLALMGNIVELMRHADSQLIQDRLRQKAAVLIQLSEQEDWLGVYKDRLEEMHRQVIQNET